MIKRNKYINAVIPAILLQCASGSVYCFSIYRTELSNILHTTNVGWFFTIVIGMLGLCAALAGKYVERDVHKSSFLAAILFFIGMIGISCGLHYHSYILTLVSFAALGSGAGIAYICPVKTLALYFPEHTGIATSISIAAFGLSKTFFTPIMAMLQTAYGTESMFCILGVVFFIMMIAGHILLAKPANWVELPTQQPIPRTMFLHVPAFWVLFIMFLLSITNGLVFIGYEQQMLREYMVYQPILVGSIAAIFNCLGRLGFSALTDRLDYKFNTYMIMSILNVITILAIVFAPSAVTITTGLFIFNATYGGFFSALVPILAKQFGIKYLSTVHSMELIAWSLGAVLSTAILSVNISLMSVFALLLVLYAILLWTGIIGEWHNYV